MSTFPGSPKLAKAGLVLVDPVSGALLRVIPLQYNPETLTRTLQVRGTTGEAGDRTEALRLTGPPIETIKLDAEIDATDQLEFPDQNATTVEVGLQAHLAALETIVYPSSARAAGQRSPRARRHARDRADGSAAHTVRLEQESRPAGAAHGFFDHGRSLRSAAESDPGEGEPRDDACSA